MNFFNKYIFGTAVPLLLIGTGIFYMFYLKLFHIRRLGVITRSLLKKNKIGGVSPIRALMLALAGTLGVGNIVGVTSAIVLGGFGAVFWMWISAFFAMLLKYAEIIAEIIGEVQHLGDPGINLKQIQNDTDNESNKNGVKERLF